MSYQVLARKWRPKQFADMVGQTHVLRALTNALDSERVHHAYLFTGTRGVGKTTLARILAKCLNCETGMSATPCGHCGACTAIDEGRFVDLIEVDAASKAKVDETRGLMDNVQYAPSTGRYKVYLIDEVHMFSGHSFNALLKTLEEPPPYVQFLLATTEPKKIPVTVLSRCLQFNLKQLSIEQIAAHLKKVLESESIDSDDASRQLIAQSANGSLRDALSLLDQAINHGGGRLSEAEVRDMLGTIDSQHLHQLVKALVDGDTTAAMQCADQMAAYHPDYDAILVELLAMLQKIAVCQILKNDDEYDQTIRTLADRADSEDLQLYYQIGILGRRDLSVAPDPRMGFEMVLVRMLAFRPEGKTTIDQAPPTAQNVSPATRRHPKTTAENTRAVTTPPSPTDRLDWQNTIDAMALSGMVKELARHSALKEYRDNRIVLELPAEHELLLTQAREKRLLDALQRHLGGTTKLTIHLTDPGTETPAQKHERVKLSRQMNAESTLKNDANVRAMQETFGATLNEESIHPKDFTYNNAMTGDSHER